MIHKVLLCTLAVLCMVGIVLAGENLTFSVIPPTLIPQTYGAHYENISENDRDWVTIAGIVPRPFVDYFGENSELGWQIFFLILIGSMFLIMFGRQANVVLPLITFLIVGTFVLALFPKGLIRWYVVMVTAAALGVIIYLGRRKR